VALIWSDQPQATQPIDVSAAPRGIATDPLRPSEYTALLLQALLTDAPTITGVRALEIGFGSGVLLAALGSLGAAHLCGVDIEPQAVTSASQLLAQLGFAEQAELFEGDMWEPVAGRQFDLVIANLPHFPTRNGPVGSRLPSWSRGGADGREFLDIFIEGLGNHLHPNGRALLTHNAFVDIDLSRQMAARSGLHLRVVIPSLVFIPAEKFRTMTDSVRQAQVGRTLHVHGPYCFGEMCIVELRQAGSLS
jgi:release factor glutamine methyltransferase